MATSSYLDAWLTLRNHREGSYLLEWGILFFYMDGKKDLWYDNLFSMPIYYIN